MLISAFIVSVLACSVALAFPTHPNTASSFPNLQCPCCIAGTSAGAGAKRIASPDIGRLVDVLTLYVNVADEESRKLQKNVMNGRILEPSTLSLVESSHWPYVYKLDPSAASVQQALAMGEQFVLGILYDQLVKYLKYVNFVTVDEQNWAGALMGVRLRAITYEDQALKLEQPHLSDLLCAFHQLLSAKDISDTAAVTAAAQITYWREANIPTTDKRNAIILNSFTGDFLAFLKLYLGEYRQRL